MQWSIITVGKSGHPWVKEALELYWKRLQHYAHFDNLVIKEAAREKSGTANSDRLWEGPVHDSR
jgi:23S rRNA pseudoU1915 N3-methylase RlmH